MTTITYLVFHRHTDNTYWEHRSYFFLDFSVEVVAGRNLLWSVNLIFLTLRFEEWTDPSHFPPLISYIYISHGLAHRFKNRNLSPECYFGQFANLINNKNISGHGTTARHPPGRARHKYAQIDGPAASSAYYMKSLKCGGFKVFCSTGRK